VNVREGITLQQKINGQHRISLNSTNIAGSAENILRIRRQNKKLSVYGFKVQGSGFRVQRL